MASEIERKFLVNETLWATVHAHDGYHIEQGYLANSDEKTIRVRTYNNKGFITIKGKANGIERAEYEYDIPFQDATEILQNLCESIIKKIRRTVIYKDNSWEVDEFSGDNEGLLLAELELTDKDELFDLPPWIGKEVSDDKRYYNAYLAEHPYKDWK